MRSPSDSDRDEMPGSGEVGDSDVTMPAPATGGSGSGEGVVTSAMHPIRPMPRVESRSEVPEITDVNVGELLGRGAQGVVYRGFQEFLRRDVAIKVLHQSADRDLARFRQEAKLLASLHHPNIVACYQAGVGPGGECYMVLEYVDGPDLHGYVKENGPLDERAALTLTLDVARGLEHGYEHGSRMIHRDIKPQNILIQETGSSSGPQLRAKVADLGLARCLEESLELTREGSLMGTPLSMAPEQFDCPRDADHRTDIYGLGCVLFYALTGAPAFNETTITSIYKQKVGEKTSRPHRDLPVSTATKALLDRMLAPQQGKRPGTYKELIDGINHALQVFDGPCLIAQKRRRRLVRACIGGSAVVLGGVLLLVRERSAGGQGGDGPSQVTPAPPDSAPSGLGGSSPKLEDSPQVVAPGPMTTLRHSSPLLDELPPGDILEMIQPDIPFVGWRSDYRGHSKETRPHRFCSYDTDSQTPTIAVGPMNAFEDEQPVRLRAGFLDDLRGKGGLAPEFLTGASELSHPVPAGSWTFEGDIALRRRNVTDEFLLGGVGFCRGDGSFLEVAFAAVLPGAEGLRPRVLVRSTWFGPDGIAMGEAFRDHREGVGATGQEACRDFMVEGALGHEGWDEAALSLRLENLTEEGVVLILGENLEISLEVPGNLEAEPILRVTAFSRLGEVYLRRWRLVGD